MSIWEPHLTPEEDSIGEPDEQDDEIDDLMPADLWFHLDRAEQPSLES